MRRALDLTQEEASELVGVARNTWARWEAGDMEPHPLMWAHLSSVISQLRGMRLAEDRTVVGAGWTNAPLEPGEVWLPGDRR